MIKKLLGIIILSGALAGCSADWYRRDADLQAYKVLEDRKQTTLGYQPTAEAGTEKVAPPTKPSYAKIPVTPIPPPIPSPVESTMFRLKYDRLGPQTQAEDTSPPPSSGFQTADLQRQSLERLRLGPAAAGQQAVVQLDLLSAVEYAVNHSRNYKNQMEDLYIASLDVLLQRHAFELQPFASTGLQYSRGPRDANSKYSSALQATNTVGVRQRLPYGGDVTARALVSFVDALNDNTTEGESSELAISGSIPLMRGAGIVNLNPLIQSERDLVYQVRTFENFRRTFAVSISRAYFQLVTQQQSITNRRLKYMSSTSLTERTRELYGAGRVNFLQVQQSLSTALSDEDNLVSSEERYQNSVDAFKILIGMPVEQNLDIQAVELDVQMPDTTRADMVDVALKYRLDLQTERDRIEDFRRQVEVRQNLLLPDLTVTASSSIGNRRDDAARDIDNREFQYSAGVNLDFPLDRVAERNSYRIALINFDQQQRTFLSKRDDVMLEVRTTSRALRSAQISYEIQRRAVDLAQRRLDYSNELLKQGQATARDVTESQTTLLNAQDSFNSAKAELQVDILQFLQDTGTLRLDPEGGSLGHAMNLVATATTNGKTPVQRTGG